MDIIDSPINYSGNKFKLMNFIRPLFPENINTFYDLCCGGGSVSVNVKANKIIANDINTFVLDILKYFKENDANKTINEIENIIAIHKLSKHSKETYNKFRYYYNNVEKTPINLFVLSCFSFNYQFRFNSKGEYNNASGFMCNEYNKRIADNIINFSNRLNKVTFTNKNIFDIDFNCISKDDFVYVDPPYSNSTASYNDNRRFFGGWDVNDDTRLFEILDALNQRGIRWAMSNAFVNNGFKNYGLIKWADKYNTHKMTHRSYNSNYQRKSRNKTTEVFITNYDTNIKEQLRLL